MTPDPDQRDRLRQSGQCSELRVCPPCNGTGLVSRPPGIAGDVKSWHALGTKPYLCRSCNGTGWISPDKCSPTTARRDVVTMSSDGPVGRVDGEWFWSCPLCLRAAAPFGSCDAANAALGRHICRRGAVIPFVVNVAFSCGGPAVWWLPKASARRWSLLVGWLLFSFYVEVRRIR